jgi:hypothetical protein
MTDGPPKAPEARIDAILPPDGTGPAPSGQDGHDAAEASRIVAHWMDEFIRLPGTNIRLGFDPLLGLIPVAGGLLSTCISLIVVAEGARLRLPAAVLGRMGLNILINEILDSIPVAGDFLSVFFRSNSRNLALIHRWKSGEHKKVRRGSRFMLIGLMVLLVALIGAWFFLWISVFAWIWQRITG